MIVKKRGKEVKASALKNCTGCLLYTPCKDKRKSHKFACTRFKSFSTKDRAEKVEKVKKAVRSGGLSPRAPEKLRFKPSAKSEEQDAFEASLQAIVSDESGILKDLRVDDSDFPLAPNFMTWCLSKKYLNLNPKPYAKQMQIGLNLLADYCPRCSDVDYVKDIPTHDTMDDIKDRVQLLRYGKCPVCGMTRDRAVAKGTLSPYNELAANCGQRSGKSYVVGLLASYQTHRYLKLQHPSRYFGLADTILHGTFVGPTFQLAKDTLWDPFYKNITESPWFKGYHKFLDQEGERLGEKLYRLGEEFVNYRHRGISCYPASPDMRNLRGRTRFFCSIDEIGWFDNAKNTTKVRMDAKEIYGALGRSLQTLRSEAERMVDQGAKDVPMPMFWNISSPTSKMDMITELVKQSQEPDNNTMYGVHFATWEMNPKISKKSLRKEFREDAARAWRDFGAVPPLSGSSFIDKIKHFEGVIQGSLRNAALLTPTLVETVSKKLLTSGKLKWLWEDSTVPKIMTIDAGYATNSFAFTVGHVDPEGFPIFDMMGEIAPVAGKPISFTDVYENILLPVINRMNVRLCVSDRWQNIKLLQDIETYTGCRVDQYSVKYNDFLQFRESLYAGEFRIPRPELTRQEIQDNGPESYPKAFETAPVAHFVFQSLTVTDVEGKTVEKTGDVQDDVFRAAVLLHAYLTNPTTAGNFQGLINMRGAGSHMGLGALVNASSVKTGASPISGAVMVRASGGSMGTGMANGASVSGALARGRSIFGR